MKTVLEFGNEMMEKNAANVPYHQLPAYIGIPAIAGLLGGKLYSDFTAPPAKKHETFQTELLKDRLISMLEERQKQKDLDKLEEVVHGSKRSLRI
jgi:hypothetical protein